MIKETVGNLFEAKAEALVINRKMNLKFVQIRNKLSLKRHYNFGETL